MDRQRLKLYTVTSLRIILAISLCYEIDAQTDVLEQLLGKDLWKHLPTLAQEAEIERLAGSVQKGFFMEPSSWYIWKTNRGGRTRYVMLLGESLAIIPGGTSACIQLFDATRTLIRSRCFQTGWRNQLTSASLEYSEELNADLVVIRTTPVINGRDIRNEYFSISGDQVKLVRLENSVGTMIPNDYVFPNYEIGAIPLAQTVEDWTSLLNSNDKSEVLSALIFLGGRHLDTQEQMLYPKLGRSSYAPLYQQLISTAAIRDLLSQLMNSSSPWIREAAVLAARNRHEGQQE